MPDEVCRAELCSKVSSYISYVISGGLVATSDAMKFLNSNAAACGVMLGILTYLTNLYYKRKVMKCRCRVLGVGYDHTSENHPHRRAGDPYKDAFD